MFDIVDTQKIKKKFGLLLSKLYTDNKLSCREISEIIINNDYFDFLEKQNSKLFLNDSYENIAKNIFKAETIFSKETLSEFYWAGLMYMSISLNKRIPLRQVMLLCPLDKMLSYFEIYHEMNDSQLIERFMKEDYQASILKKLRKKRNLTVKELALASNIPLLTIKYYEKNNNNLFKASFENILKLTTVLNYSETIFSRYSKYIPYTYLLFEDQELFKSITNKIDAYYGNIGQYHFDGVLLERAHNKRKEYVKELYLTSSIEQTLIEYSKKENLLF